MQAKVSKKSDTSEMLAFIVEHMATKDDIADVRREMATGFSKLQEQISGIEREVRLIRADLADLQKRVRNIEGFKLEIDHALERIAAIEKHLGITHAAEQ